MVCAVPFCNGFDRVWYPRKATEMESTVPDVLSSKYPSKFEVVPWVVPLNTTLANAMGSWVVASVTFPFTVVFWP
jgi:hypothetical protein